MDRPWLDDFDQAGPAPGRRRGCGCSWRVKLILLGVVVALILACFLGNIMIERYRTRERIQLQQTIIAPTPRSTPVVVPPPGRAGVGTDPPGGG